MRTITAISTLSVATAALIFVSAPVETASAAERTTERTPTTLVQAEYGKDGAKGGNVEFEWKIEEGES